MERRRLRDWRAAWEGASEEAALRPDVRRGVRATVGMMVPLGLASAGWLPLEGVFVLVAANGMTLADVRGAYPVRFAFLVAMVVVLAGTTLLGTVSAGHAWVAVAATAVVGLNAGLWRHLTPEYGPSLAAPAGLLFFIAALTPASGGDHALAALVGAVWGLVVQVAAWPIRYEHPLRRAVAESWLAAGELFGAYASSEEGRAGRVADRETKLRAALDRGYETLAGVRGRRWRGTVGRLERLHLEAARLGTAVGALGAAIEPVVAGDTRGVGAAWGLVAESLAGAARSVAVAVVSRQPAHLALGGVQLRRAGSLLESLRGRVGEGSVEYVAGVVERHLRAAGEALRAVVERAGERAIFPLELLELDTWRLRPLAAVLNLSTRPDPAIVRFTLRSMVVRMLAVGVAEAVPIPHRYWLPYTVLVVMQADFGATRRKAAQRLLGTLLGSILGSGVLMLRLPHGVVLGAVGVTGMVFAYYLRRNYAVAVVFITLFVVLLTEASRPVTVALTAERLGATVAGGVLALVAAFLFWPTWERERFPGLLAAAVRANRDYLGVLAEQVGRGGGDRERRVAGKRVAERANREVFGSLERLFADPASRREGAERMAVLANGNQRLTRALNVVSVGMDAGEVGEGRESAGAYARQLMGELEEVAGEVGRRGEEGGASRVAVAEGELQLPAGGWVAGPLLRAGAEVAAMRGKVGGAFGEEGDR